MTANVDGLTKIVALVLWADEKVTTDEWAGARRIFKKYGIPWAEAKKDLERHVEELLRPGEPGEEFEEKDEEFEIGNVSLGEVDDFEVLCDLALLIVADKKVTYTEIDILHRIARAIDSQPELATAAIVKAVVKKKSRVKLD
jgi:hypothetical protein